jgi:hypothetical protein
LVKARELLVAGGADDGSPWDCGTLRGDVGGLLALRAFRPRRPSLVVVQEALLTPDDRRWLAAAADLKAPGTTLHSAPEGLPWCVLLLREAPQMTADSSPDGGLGLHWRPGVWLE